MGTINVDSEQQAAPASHTQKEVKQKSKMASATRRSAFFMVFGALGVVLGAIAVVFWPALFFEQLKNMMVLTPTSTSFNIWRSPPIPMYLECFMWNITNVDEILANKDAQLKVTQLGPYVYREEHEKVNLTWNSNNTVTFYNKRVWHFVPEMSNGSLSDNITSINPIVATVAYTLRHQGEFTKITVNAFLRAIHETLFLTANVSSWLFDGIEDPVLNIASHFPNLPIVIPYDKFGWFYERNKSITFDGVFLMNTGAEDFSQLGNIEKWQHSNRTQYRDHCGTVQGSTGELWAPEIGQPEVIIFAPDICTYMILAKNRSVVVENIEGVEYAANSSIFDNGHRYPHMACYCDKVRDENCLPPGALNVSECRFGAPAFVSLPHFLGADPHYPSKIQGLDPKPEHNFRLALEMFTGMPLSVSAQLQINLLVRHVSGFTVNNQLPDADTLVPMFWFRQEVLVTPEYARLARFALNLRYGVPYGLYALTAIGIALLVTGIVILVKKLMHSPDTAPILEQDNSSH
ncbi:protein croquemort-like isoform X1 [Pectinophora gossypiella]|uniref:protein croquemort-like isoform X1 n=2 Tax=Pectinophora gossypiella TaxID=13191 RepID=UPI00214EAA7F|nr:protein croquemort-like isoform X1 [Pectinophora gossypiella]